MNPIRWNMNTGLIPNREGARIRVLAKDAGAMIELAYIVAKGVDRRHFLSSDGTPDGALPFHAVIAWRLEQAEPSQVVRLESNQDTRFDAQIDMIKPKGTVREIERTPGYEHVTDSDIENGLYRTVYRHLETGTLWMRDMAPTDGKAIPYWREAGDWYEGAEKIVTTTMTTKTYERK